MFDNLDAAKPKNHFIVGINDDVTKTSLAYDPSFSTAGRGVYRAMFYGLGSDGTVGANKNSIKIIGDETDNYAQGYFVYDSKKAGSMTVSHLRFGKKPIRSPYLIDQAEFHRLPQPELSSRNTTCSARLEDGGTFLLTPPFEPNEVWDTLPQRSAAADHRQERSSST